MKKISSVLLLLTLTLAVIVGLRWALSMYKERQLSGKLTIDKTVKDQSHAIGDFLIRFYVTEGGSLIISHKSKPNFSLWANVTGESFLAAAQGKEKVKEARGSFFVQDEILIRCSDQFINKAEYIDERFTISGYLSCDGKKVDYTFSIKPFSKTQVSFDFVVANPVYNRTYLTYQSDSEEGFFGFGEQFTYFNMKGRKLPILVMEQGIGRGTEPITTGANLMADSGGDWHTSYAGIPHYITSKMRSLFLRNYEYLWFDLRKANRVQISVFSNEINGNIVYGGNPQELIQSYTEYAGRMRTLPDWVHSGAIIGMQGGTAKVRQIHKKLTDMKTPLSGYWLQDWVGQRITTFGKQLWWNWELDNDRYPQWKELVNDLAKENVRVLTYINPFLADVKEKKNARQNLFQEAKDKGYLIKNDHGKTYMILNTSFSAALLDLTNVDARKWIKEVIKKNIIQTGSSGWMADFGEALPFDSVLASGEKASAYHNRYPEEWAKVNREAIEEAGRNDIVFFSRSGYMRSPAYSTLFWLGDQLVSWDMYDGIKSAVTGLLTGGMSGYSLNHSDIGGYTTIKNPIKNYYRSKELLLRWIELNAFSPIFRTHEGNIPDKNHQIYNDNETLAFFSKFAKVYHAWFAYRKQLIQEASKTGMPVVRHLFIHYPEDKEVQKISYEQFMIGSEFIVAPVLDPANALVRVYLPKGEWVHVWSQKVHGKKDKGLYIEVNAPLGQPAVFYKKGSKAGEAFYAKLNSMGILDIK